MGFQDKGITLPPTSKPGSHLEITRLSSAGANSHPSLGWDGAVSQLPPFSIHTVPPASGPLSPNPMSPHPPSLSVYISCYLELSPCVSLCSSSLVSLWSSLSLVLLSQSGICSLYGPCDLPCVLTPLCPSVYALGLFLILLHFSSAVSQLLHSNCSVPFPLPPLPGPSPTQGADRDDRKQALALSRRGRGPASHTSC